MIDPDHEASKAPVGNDGGVSFYGAAGTVTGSRFLVEWKGTRVLVDCGLFQGLKVLRLRNREPLPFDPASLDAVLLTHAHLDHSGFLPVLVREGFRGSIYCTPPTRDLAPILLADSGRLQEEDARYANRRGFSKHHPALPLYTEDDAAAVEPLLRSTPFDRDIDVGNLRVRFAMAGHILGAASIRIAAGGAAITFSGDLGRYGDPLMLAPAPPLPAEMVVMESTYGDRLHPGDDPVQQLGEVVRRTCARGGVLMIPAFAVGRAQTLMVCLHRLVSAGQIPDVPVFLNSPMAIDVTALYERHTDAHAIGAAECRAAFERVRLVRTVDESKELNRRRGPLIIIAGAGMLTGGRILHHIRAFGGDRRNTILLVGHQAEGTRGAALLAGTRALKIHGSYMAVHAKVEQIDGFSAHADQSELLRWLDSCAPAPDRVYLVHGDPAASDCLRLAVRDALGLRAYVARDGEMVPIETRRHPPSDATNS
jgi:metallo-beta-lactamase family protein